MSDESAYEEVPNRSQRLLSSEVAYFAVVSSPHPRLVGQVFALEHEQTTVGRFACSDIYIDVGGELDAITGELAGHARIVFRGATPLPGDPPPRRNIQDLRTRR